MHLGSKQFEMSRCGQGALGADVVSFMQINEMRKNVARGCRQQGAGGLGIKGGGEGLWGGGGQLQGCENGGFAGFAVVDQLGEAGGGGGDFKPVAGQQALPGAFEQGCERGHIGAHIAIGRRDQRG
jgi:hypothetical protein